MNKWLTRIGWSAAVVGPPVVAVSQELITKHPVVATVLLCLYEIVLVVLAFAGKIAGELAARWRARLVDWLDLALGRRFSRFDRRYREFVLSALRYIDVKGLATVGFYTPELDEVFVDVHLSPRAPHLVSGGVVSADPAEATKVRVISHFLDRARPIVIAIIGAPGTGKTTLLFHTAREMCRQRKGRRRTVPLLLFLRDHVHRIVSADGVTLPDVMRATLDRYRSAEPAGWFERRLIDGDCVVLLDGLDEVAGEADRRAVAAWVERQIKQYPENDYVITSRPHGYRAARIDLATVLQVRRFTDEQVSLFVRGWYRAFELAIARYNKESGTEDTAPAIERADSAAADLLDRLKKAPGLYDLTANPMLLTMIANVHRFGDQLPGSRADLYSEICQVMLGRRQEARNITLKMSAHKKEVVLQGLAFMMMRQRVRDLPQAEVLAAFKPALRRISDELTAEELLADVGSTGVLVERENGLYAFAHQTFQEYLAAAHIREKGLISVLTDAVDDVWWRETTLLYAARSDADPIIRACLSSDSVPAISLAFDCTAQPSEIAPELRDRLDQLLGTAFDPDADPQRRQLMAGVMVTRHLRQFISTGDTARVCTEPITTALYRLFREDQSTSDRYVLGVRSGEAVAFAQWVNDITGGEPSYRLPTRAELDDPVVRRTLTTSLAGFSAWLQPVREGDEPELWTAHDTHPHLVGTEVLTAHVTADVRQLTSTLARLLLLRSALVLLALARARAVALDSALAGDLRRALELAQDLDSSLDLAQAPDLARDLDSDGARARARARTRARELARDSTLDLTFALTRARTREGNTANTTARARAGDSAFAGDTARAGDLARDLARDLAHDLDRARDLVQDSAPARVLALDRSLAAGVQVARALDWALSRTHTLDSLVHALDNDGVLGRLHTVESTLRHFVGRALSHALHSSARVKDDVAGFQTRFAKVFVAETGVAQRRVSLDSLAGKVQGGREAFQAVPSVSQWTAAEVARRLEEIALPVFTWQRPLTAMDATAIRLAALCLAAEADKHHLTALGEDYREIAAGVTLLERRANGLASPTEAIILTSV